jgi:hypothetical protein
MTEVLWGEVSENTKINKWDMKIELWIGETH